MILDAPRAQTQPLPDAALLAALRQRDFEPFFEPKLDTASGRVAGFEVLARLPGHQGRWIGPGQFVGALERLDRIHELTLILLDKALQSLATWQLRWPQLTLSLNAAAQSLSREGFAAGLVALARAHGVPAQQLIIEVTESAPLASLRDGLDSLVRLRTAGFSLAIDDFGTGHSSIEQLTKAPFTELKIDQMFTRHLVAQPEMRAVFESCMVVARKFGLRVCAEGVEHPGTLRLAADLGAHELQGWLIQPAMPAAEVPSCLLRFSDGQQYRAWYDAGG
jgi:EAL domain-containing protein (putative c-di-GMP-specific phosphodiesterase class I)